MEDHVVQLWTPKIKAVGDQFRATAGKLPEAKPELATTSCVPSGETDVPNPAPKTRTLSAQ
ncbi:hypothetical protein ACIPC1_11545 [Streptomyces sp. NPDC087263]|uniref:hypothetical protein n=1 Tax=Streptomyces sp. NPDC087263 TaxID=3365773 RepID=UPI00380BB45D